MEKETRKKISFIIKFGAALQQYGANAFRTEAALEKLSDVMGIKGEFFFTPTFLMGSFKFRDEEYGQVKRMTPGSVNLDKLCALDELGNDIVAYEIDPEDYFPRLNSILKAPGTYPVIATILSFPLLSASIATLFGGNIFDIVAAAIAGILVGLNNVLISSRDHFKDISEGMDAFIAGIASVALTLIFPEINYKTVMLSSLIVLMPGLSLTTAMSELATNNLASGTARLMGTFMTFLKISFGVAFSTKIMTFFITPEVAHNPINYPAWSIPIILLLSSLSLTCLFQARPKDFPLAALAGLLGFYSTMLGSQYLGVEFGPFLGGMMVGSCSNLFAKRFNRPATLMLLPGIILLVPGSIGYKGLDFFFQKEFISGMGEAFKMLIISISLVAGLFFGNVLIKPRRNL